MIFDAHKAPPLPLQMSKTHKIHLFYAHKTTLIAPTNVDMCDFDSQMMAVVDDDIWWNRVLIVMIIVVVEGDFLNVLNRKVVKINVDGCWWVVLLDEMMFDENDVLMFW